MIAILNAWSFIRRFGVYFCLGALALMLAFAKGDARHWHKVADGREIALTQLKADVSATTAAAEMADRANAQRAEIAQSKITLETENEYQAKLADLHRRYDAIRLRPAPRTHQSGGTAADLPSLPDTTSSIDDPAGENGFPTASTGGITTEDALIASETALRLAALQNWVRDQITAATEKP